MDCFRVIINCSSDLTESDIIYSHHYSYLTQGLKPCIYPIVLVLSIKCPIFLYILYLSVLQILGLIYPTTTDF